MAKPEYMKKWWATRKANLLRERAEMRREAENPSVPYKGDNFRFVAWSELADLRLWRRR